MPDQPRGILLVEGRDDQHVVLSLCMLHQLAETFDVHVSGSRSEVLRELPRRMRESGRNRVGLIIDADTDVAGAWTSVRTAWERRGLGSLPRQPDPRGTIVRSGDPFVPDVGAWLMPDNRSDGKLEDFIRVLVPDASFLWAHAENAVAGIPAGERRFRETDTAKAHVHTYLAWQEQPGAPVGLSITQGAFDGGHEHAQRLVAWLRRLFAEERNPQ